MALAPIVIWIIILAIRAASASAPQSRGVEVATGWDTSAVVRITVGLAWFVVSGLVLSALGDNPDASALARLIALAIGLAAIGVVLFAPWQVLLLLAKRAHPKVVYYAAKTALPFARSGESHASAVLLSALAVAYRGPADKATRKWLWARLETDVSARGTFGTAYGVIEALEARAAREQKRPRAAYAHAERGRLLLGTVTFMSSAGVPNEVRRLAHELLDLECVERGMWGGLESTAEALLTKVTRALHEFSRLRFDEADNEKVAARTRKRAASPLVEALYARPTERPLIKSAADAQSRACRDYLSLLAYEPLTPRAGLQVLRTLDILLSPGHDDSLIPVELWEDEPHVDALQDEVATAIAETIHRGHGVPVFAMPGFGPISARVHQKLEVAVLQDVERTFAKMIASTESKSRGEPRTEWLEAAQGRGVYRRVQLILGNDAAARVWPRFLYAYSHFGVKLSETWPRRRPLAHAVFKCLEEEALRLEDAHHVALFRKNLGVTSG